MSFERVEGIWLTNDPIPLVEFLELSGISETELRELIDYGALLPIDPSADPWQFHAACLLTVRTARRLRESFDLELDGVAVIITLLDRIRDLERQLNGLLALSPGRSQIDAG